MVFWVGPKKWQLQHASSFQKIEILERWRSLIEESLKKKLQRNVVAKTRTVLEKPCQGHHQLVGG